MTIQTISEIIYPSTSLATNGNSVPGNNDATLDASGEQYAVILQAPRSGTITEVGFQVSPTPSVGDADVRLESVDTTTGYPSGTLLGTNTNATLTISTSGWKTATLTVGAVVTEGDLIAVVVKNVSGNWRVRYGTLAAAGFPYLAANLSGVWSKLNGPPRLALGYGGTYYQLSGTYSEISSVAFNSGSTPDEIGNLFTLPVGLRVRGMWAGVDFDGMTDIVLYQGSTVVASYSVDPDVRFGVSSQISIFRLNGSVVLAADTPYRLVIKPTTTTNVTLLHQDLASAALRAASILGSDWQYTSRADGGAWTETATRVALLHLLVDGIDVPSGGAVSISPARGRLGG